MLVMPETHYAKSGDVRIAYQVVGNGPLDLIFVPGFISNLDNNWDHSGVAHLYNRLVSFSRLILFDKRGTGLSDRDTQIPTLEQRMDDVRAVLDAVGSKEAALFGISEGGAMAMLFAATYPQRVRSLVLYGTYAHFPTWVLSNDKLEGFLSSVETNWGTGASINVFAPSVADDPQMRAWWGRFERHGASPSAVVALMRMNSEIDIRHVLPAIRVPTLVLHRCSDTRVNVGSGRDLSQNIPGAKYLELPGVDHALWVGDMDRIIDEIEVFITGTRVDYETERMLTTLLFTDIVASTTRAVALGDKRWRELLDQHDDFVRREITRMRGREVKTLGDGFLATFDGPARAVRCAVAITEAVRILGIEVRCGVHTGEIELKGEDIVGIAVNIAARVAAVAVGSQVLVSSTVRDLVAGSGLSFRDGGMHALKGIPDEIHLFAV
jgi:class 3 adenylate cyclase